MKRVIVVLALAMLVFLPALGAQVSAQSVGWSRPIGLSNPASSSWFPSLAAGYDGRVYVLWNSTIGGPPVDEIKDLLMFSELRAGAWSQPNDISNPGRGGFVTRNSIVVGRDGRLHVLVRSSQRIDYLSAPWDTAWSANAWTPLHRISNGGTPYYDALAIDAQGNLHAFWNETVDDDPRQPNTICSRCADLFYRRSADGGATWSAPINISQTPDGSTKPQIKIDKNDHLHLVWTEGYDNLNGKGQPRAVMYRRSRTGGVTWDPPVTFTLPGDAPQQIALGLHGDVTPIVVYRATKTDMIYYQVGAANGTNWSTAAPLPGVRARSILQTPWDRYVMATDGVGNVHLIFSGLLASNNDPIRRPSVLHLVWDGRAWSEPETISDQLFPEWPDVAIGAGNKLHVTWFTRNEQDLWDPDHSHYRIWYSMKILDAPAMPDLPTFTPMPTLAPPAAPTSLPATPTPTPLALADRQAPLVSGPPAWEQQGLLTLALALLPAFGMLAVVLAVHQRIRRRRGS